MDAGRLVLRPAGAHLEGTGPPCLEERAGSPLRKDPQMENAPSNPRRPWQRLLRPASGMFLLPAALLLPGLGVAQSPTSTGSQPPTTPQAQDTSQTPSDRSAMTPGNTAPGNTGTAPWAGPGTSNPTGSAPGTGGTGTDAPTATGAPGTLLERPGEEDDGDRDALPGTVGSGSDPQRQLGEPAGQPIPGMEKTVPPQVEVPRPPTPQSGTPSQGP